MFITLELSNGKKVTKEHNHIYVFENSEQLLSCRLAMEDDKDAIYINYDHVVSVHEATDDEIWHSKIHGY